MKTKVQTFRTYLKKVFKIELIESEYKNLLANNKALKVEHSNLNSIRRTIIESYNNNKLDNFCPLSFDIVLNMKKPSVYKYMSENIKSGKNGYSFKYVLEFIRKNKEILQGLK